MTAEPPPIDVKELEPVPSCFICNRPVGDGSGLLPYVRVELAETREIVDCCDLCFEDSE